MYVLDGVFPERFKTIREKRGITLLQLSGKLKRPFQELADYETGKVTPSLQTAAKLASVLDVSLDYLVGLSKDPGHGPGTFAPLLPSWLQGCADDLYGIDSSQQAGLRLIIRTLSGKPGQMSPDRDIFANTVEPKASELSERAGGLWPDPRLTAGSTADVFDNEVLRRTGSGPKPRPAGYQDTAKAQVLDDLYATETMPVQAPVDPAVLTQGKGALGRNLPPSAPSSGLVDQEAPGPGGRPSKISKKAGALSEFGPAEETRTSRREPAIQDPEDKLSSAAEGHLSPPDFGPATAAPDVPREPEAPEPGVPSARRSKKGGALYGSERTRPPRSGPREPEVQESDEELSGLAEGPLSSDGSGPAEDSSLSPDGSGPAEDFSLSPDGSGPAADAQDVTLSTEGSGPPTEAQDVSQPPDASGLPTEDQDVTQTQDVSGLATEAQDVSLSPDGSGPVAEAQDVSPAPDGSVPAAVAQDVSPAPDGSGPAAEAQDVSLEPEVPESEGPPAKRSRKAGTLSGPGRSKTSRSGPPNPEDPEPEGKLTSVSEMSGLPVEAGPVVEAQEGPREQGVGPGDELTGAAEGGQPSVGSGLVAEAQDGLRETAATEPSGPPARRTRKPRALSGSGRAKASRSGSPDPEVPGPEGVLSRTEEPALPSGSELSEESGDSLTEPPAPEPTPTEPGVPTSRRSRKAGAQSVTGDAKSPRSGSREPEVPGPEGDLSGAAEAPALPAGSGPAEARDGSSEPGDPPARKKRTPRAISGTGRSKAPRSGSSEPEAPEPGAGLSGTGGDPFTPVGTVSAPEPSPESTDASPEREDPDPGAGLSGTGGDPVPSAVTVPEPLDCPPERKDPEAGAALSGTWGDPVPPGGTVPAPESLDCPPEREVPEQVAGLSGTWEDPVPPAGSVPEPESLGFRQEGEGPGTGGDGPGTAAALSGASENPLPLAGAELAEVPPDATLEKESPEAGTSLSGMEEAPQPPSGTGTSPSEEPHAGSPEPEGPDSEVTLARAGEGSGTSAGPGSSAVPLTGPPEPGPAFSRAGDDRRPTVGAAADPLFGRRNQNVAEPGTGIFGRTGRPRLMDGPADPVFGRMSTSSVALGTGLYGPYWWTRDPVFRAAFLKDPVFGGTAPQARRPDNGFGPVASLSGQEAGPMPDPVFARPASPANGEGSRLAGTQDDAVPGAIAADTTRQEQDSWRGSGGPEVPSTEPEAADASAIGAEKSLEPEAPGTFAEEARAPGPGPGRRGRRSSGQTPEEKTKPPSVPRTPRGAKGDEMPDPFAQKPEPCLSAEVSDAPEATEAHAADWRPNQPDLTREPAQNAEAAKEPAVEWRPDPLALQLDVAQGAGALGTLGDPKPAKAPKPDWRPDPLGLKRESGLSADSSEALPQRVEVGAPPKGGDSAGDGLLADLNAELETAVLEALAEDSAPAHVADGAPDLGSSKDDGRLAEQSSWQGAEALEAPSSDESAQALAPPEVDDSPETEASGAPESGASEAEGLRAEQSSGQWSEALEAPSSDESVQALAPPEVDDSPETGASGAPESGASEAEGLRAGQRPGQWSEALETPSSAESALPRAPPEVDDSPETGASGAPESGESEAEGLRGGQSSG
ncbi:MAG: helix-turn-helix domain-containing protein, partial [Deltaproteobacteria bacterium]|nr:helix-turn-helix domain-containing protein [Deltaproteobacteria bacterium]